MNQKNIFSELGFVGTTEEDLIMNKEDINTVSQFFNKIFEEVSASKQVYITKALEDEAFAISTAEESSLTEKEAASIELTNEESLRIKKYQTMDIPIEKKYEYLEFENIKSIEIYALGLGFQDLNIEIIKQFHRELTLGLDEYTSKLHISKYHSGTFRKINTVKVGKFPPYIPPKHIKIEELIKLLLKYYQSKKKIYFTDIIEFGILLYAIHPFQNGNKRVVRILESLLLEAYGYNAQNTLSIGRQYAVDKTGFHYFILQTLHKKNTAPFVNFALRKYIEEGETIMIDMLNKEVKDNFEMRILCSVQEKKKKQFSFAFSLFKKHFSLKNNKFVTFMKEKGYTHSISQTILKKMLDENILTKLSNGEYISHGFLRYRELRKFIDEKIKK